MKTFRRAFVQLNPNHRWSFNEVEVEDATDIVVLEKTEDGEQIIAWFDGTEDAEDALIFAELKNTQEQYK